MQPLASCHPAHVLAWLVPRARPVTLEQKFVDFLSKQRAICVKSHTLNPDIE
jgi:hypothetical protein